MDTMLINHWKGPKFKFDRATHYLASVVLWQYVHEQEPGPACICALCSDRYTRYHLRDCGGRTHSQQLGDNRASILQPSV